MEVSNKGLALIAKFEGYSAKPYLDQVGIPTIGYGTTFYPSGKLVTLKDQMITKEQALGYLKHHVNSNVIPPLKKLLKVELNQDQLDAVISLIYNIGAGAFKVSTLLKRINKGASCEEITKAFLMWVKAGGKTLPGLVTRRKLEAALFCKPQNQDK